MPSDNTYKGVYEDPRFYTRKDPPSGRAIGRASMGTAPVGALLGLLPALLRHSRGKQFHPGRTALESGTGAALGALLPLVAAHWRHSYQGPRGEVRSFQDIEHQLGLPVTPPDRSYRNTVSPLDKTGSDNNNNSLTKQSAVVTVPALVGMGLKWGLPAWQAWRAARTYGQSRTARRHGMDDAADALRRSAMMEGIGTAAYLLPFGKMFSWGRKGFNALRGARNATRVAQGARHAAQNATQTAARNANRFGKLKGIADLGARTVAGGAAYGSAEGHRTRGMRSVVDYTRRNPHILNPPGQGQRQSIYRQYHNMQGSGAGGNTAYSGGHNYRQIGNSQWGTRR